MVEVTPGKDPDSCTYNIWNPLVEAGNITALEYF
jgi:hypothetical protein